MQRGTILRHLKDYFFVVSLQNTGSILKVQLTNSSPSTLKALQVITLDNPVDTNISLHEYNVEKGYFSATFDIDLKEHWKCRTTKFKAIKNL